MPAQKLRISFRCPVPARILHKGIICPEIHAHRGRRHNARLAVLDARFGPCVVHAAVPSPAPRNKVVRLHRIGLRRLFQTLRRGPDGQNGVPRISRGAAPGAAQGPEGRSGARSDLRRRRNEGQHPPVRIPRRDVQGHDALYQFDADRSRAQRRSHRPRDGRCDL